MAEVGNISFDRPAQQKYSASRVFRRKVVDDTYYNPEGLYRFKMPQMLAGAKIEDHFLEDNISAVIIQDDYGNLVRVEVIVNTQENMDKFNEFLKASYEGTFRHLFELCVLESISQG